MEHAAEYSVHRFSKEFLLNLYKDMLVIRYFEDEVQRLFMRNLVRGSTHLYQGQEAVAVGSCSALRPDDTMTCTYRGHGAVLAKGTRPDRAFAEILGRTNGLCEGRGGSMHLTDTAVGALGSFAIVGANIPVTVGAAFTAQYRQTDGVSIAFFGDGATNIGVFHEALNLAAIWKLPAIFICENNLYGEYSPLATTTPVARLAERAASYAIPSTVVDGNDVLAVFGTVSRVVADARAGKGPAFVEALTYRQQGHSRTDPGVYRPAGELEEWVARDPILLLKDLLTAEGICGETELREVAAAVEADVHQALERALTWPEPDASSLLEYVSA